MKINQAQIEAAADNIPTWASCYKDPTKIILPTRYDLLAAAKRILTAAAEAGEQREPDEMCLRVGHRWVIECQRCGDNRTVQSEIIATIERCAQVAENNVPKTDGGMAYVKAIAAAIRALKDK